MKLWYRLFKVLDEKQALKLNLKFSHNVYGDLINLLNCRSIYKDDKNRYYRIAQLKQ